MSILANQLEQALQPGMSVPEPIRLLFEWIEREGFYTDDDDGQRIGGLFPDEQLHASWTDEERDGGTLVWFYPQESCELKYWFGHDRAEVLSRLCVFARTGADGSMAAFWLDDTGHQRIVHLGSGSGSTLSCVLADDAVDFLRLIAIGYDEICWDGEFRLTPADSGQNNEFIVHPNVRFQDWVKHTFHVEIPATALEIVKTPARMDDARSADSFHQWVARNIA